MVDKEEFVQQILVDPEGHNDWIAELNVDLMASRTSTQPVFVLNRIGPMASSGGS